MKQTFLALTLVASLGFGLVQLDVSIVNVALVSFAHAFDASTAVVVWIVDAYAIAFACLLMAGGALGDRVGAKRTLQCGLAIFGIGSLGCALAPNLATLIAMRVIQGVGAASLVPCSLALIAGAARDDGKQRAHAVAVWTAAGSISLALGPVVGGALLATAGWRAIFLINLPLCAVALWLTHRFAAETVPRAGRFDPLGQLLAVVTLLGATACIVEVGALGLGASLVRIALLAMVLGGAAFVFVESRSADPMMPLSFFRNATFSACVFTGFAINASLYGTLFALALFWQRQCGYAPLAVGFAFVPLAVALGVANVWSGTLIARCGSRGPLLGGLSLAFGGFALLLLCGATTPYLALIPALVVIPSGIGVAVPAMTSALLATVPPERSGIASGVLNTVRQAAGALGVATAAALMTRFGPGRGLHYETMIWLLAVALASGVAALGLERTGAHRTLGTRADRRDSASKIIYR